MSIELILYTDTSSPMDQAAQIKLERNFGSGVPYVHAASAPQVADQRTASYTVAIPRRILLSDGLLSNDLGDKSPKG
jgi:hypothetical protein